MELRDPGLDRWFADKARECGPGLTVARITAVDRARYLIRDEHGELPAELTGRLQFVAESSIDLPCVGDWVCARYRDVRSHATIHGVLPRKSFLRRKAPGKDIDFQMIAANIDVAFVIQSCHFDFNVRRLERYLVMVREGHIEPVLLLTKIDLVSVRELESLIGRIQLAGIDARIVTLSNVTGAGLDRVRELLIPGKTYCLLGSSGVGKTTLINRLAGDSGLETRDVSHTGEGRHTTILSPTSGSLRRTPAGLPQAQEGVRIPRPVIRREAQEGSGLRPIRAFRNEAQGHAGRRLGSQHAKRLRMQLAALDSAQVIDDMDIPGFRLHPLKGAERGRWSIWVNGNWRMTFEFRDGQAYVLDYEDYH